ncbi:histidine-containing phosphotransfer protein 1-like [Rhodamnia argentea]|uniref:Histidine-containing phosphotransfer protein n=1 Tax=Rhodamnia argentea TaxID=178133 RepID=A0ABM3GZL0_9MYRT|nr:histidine-containing phosphotransfer protein 1-like [Rhodamnia argentea]
MDAGLMQMQGRLADYMNALFNEEILDSQYLELHELQDESNPGFVVEVVSLFLTDAEKLLDDLSRDLTQQNVDFKRAHAQAHKLMGSSCSIGAPRVKSACIVFQNFCQEKNVRGCQRYLQQMKQEFVLVKGKLKALFELEKQVVAAGGSIHRMQPINPSH